MEDNIRTNDNVKTGYPLFPLDVMPKFQHFLFLQPYHPFLLSHIVFFSVVKERASVFLSKVVVVSWTQFGENSISTNNALLDLQVIYFTRTFL